MTKHEIQLENGRSKSRPSLHSFKCGRPSSIATLSHFVWPTRDYVNERECLRGGIWWVGRSSYPFRLDIHPKGERDLFHWTSLSFHSLFWSLPLPISRSGVKLRLHPLNLHTFRIIWSWFEMLLNCVKQWIVSMWCNPCISPWVRVSLTTPVCTSIIIVNLFTLDQTSHPPPSPLPSGLLLLSMYFPLLPLLQSVDIIRRNGEGRERERGAKSLSLSD